MNEQTAPEDGPPGNGPLNIANPPAVHVAGFTLIGELMQMELEQLAQLWARKETA